MPDDRPNFYLLLELDSSVDDWKLIEQRIREKQLEWAHDHSSGKPEARRRAEGGLALLQEIRIVLANPETRREEAKEAIRQQQRGRQKALDETIALLKSSSAPCGEEQVRQLSQQFIGTFSEDEIRKRLRASGVFLASDPKAVRPARRLIDKVMASSIRVNLDRLKLATLYDFLGLNSQSSSKALSDRAQEIYRENQRLGRTDSNAMVSNELAGICTALFQSDNEKIRYDNYLVIEALEKLRPSLELAASDNLISREELDALIQMARQRGISTEDALTYIEDYAASRKWGIQRDSSPLSSEDFKRCGFCSYLAPATASRCPRCGQSLEIECPRCSAQNSSANEACQSCGCRIGDAPLVKALLQEGYRLALEDSSGALRCFDKALLYWPDWQPAVEARERVEERLRESAGHSAQKEPTQAQKSTLPEQGLPLGGSTLQDLSHQHTPEDRPEREKPSRQRDQVFISYSHKDKLWLERLQGMLKPLVRKGSISLWDDTRITPGKQWKQEIESALASAKVAIFLVSRDFIASDFVAEKELPPLLRAAEQEGLVVLWLCLGHCLYEETEIHRFQAVHDPSKPLSSLPRRAQWEKVLADLARRVKAAIEPVPSTS